MSHVYEYHTLVQFKEEFKQYLSITEAFNIKDFLPDLEWAENKFLIPVIGQPLKDRLYNSLESSSSSQVLPDLLGYCQKVEVYFATAKYLHLQMIRINSNGVKMINTQNEKQAFQWQVEDLQKEYLLEKGYQFIEDLYKFLEENKADYPEWDGSVVSNNRKFFIRSAVDFNKHVNINESRRTYAALQQTMWRVEKFKIQSEIGTAFYNELKAAILAGTISGNNLTLVDDYIAPAVAYLTIAQVIPSGNMQITGDGITMSSIVATGLSDSMKSKGIPKDNLLGEVKDQYEVTGKALLKLMVDYLNTTASSAVFTTYFGSDKYVDPTDTDPVNPDRNPDDKLFSAL